MKQLLLILAACLLVSGCTTDMKKAGSFSLQGAWTLQRVEYPIGRVETFPDDGRTVLRIYDGDTIMYQCHLIETKAELLVHPSYQCSVTVIDKGGGESVYLEDDDPHPLTVVNDSTMMIQQNGILYTWLRADNIAREWGAEIRSIVKRDLQNDNPDDIHSYVLSSKERQQASLIHVFVCSTIVFVILLLVIVYIAIHNRRERQRLQFQLQQIQEVRDERPQSVKHAIESVEAAFFASDDYQELQRRMATGQRLRTEEWDGIEHYIKKVYPGFCSQLRSLHAMSDLEYQVCLLIKLRIAPKDMAAVLARDVSTISTVRSRLYKKVFGRKGGSREWDEFILTL